MMAHAGSQETFKERHATTTIYRPNDAEIEVIDSSRLLSNKASFSPSDGLDEKGLELEGQLNLIVQFDFAIKDRESGEFWRCDMKPNRPLCQVFVDSGDYRIVPTVCPPYSNSSSIILTRFDCKYKQLPPHKGSVVFVLPAEQQYCIIYAVMITLYDRGDKVLNELRFDITSHTEDVGLLECQNGRLLISVEKPLLKKRMAGFFGTEKGQSILFHFQRLGDNAMDILKRAKEISRKLKLAKETQGINQRMEKIPNLLRGLDQDIPRPQRPVLENEPSENEICDINDLLVEATQYENRQLQNQCTQDSE